MSMPMLTQPSSIRAQALCSKDVNSSIPQPEIQMDHEVPSQMRSVCDVQIKLTQAIREIQVQTLHSHQEHQETILHQARVHYNHTESYQLWQGWLARTGYKAVRQCCEQTTRRSPMSSMQRILVLNRWSEYLRHLLQKPCVHLYQLPPSRMEDRPSWE